MRMNTNMLTHKPYITHTLLWYKNTNILCPHHPPDDSRFVKTTSKYDLFEEQNRSIETQSDSVTDVTFYLFYPIITRYIMY